MTGLTVAPEDQSAEWYDHRVSEYQGADVKVSGNSIIGTLMFMEGGLSPAGPLSGDGYFLALKFSNLDPDATSVKVGLDPSQGTGMVEIIDDPDKVAVFKIKSDLSQTLIVEQSNATAKRVQRFNLSGLTLQE